MTHGSRFPTFEEILHLAQSESSRRERSVGVYPEVKHPAHFARLGLRHDDALLSALRMHGSGLPVYIQSFDATWLRALSARTTTPLVRLVDHETEVLTPYGLREISTYAQVLGAHKSLLLRWDLAGRPMSTGLVQRAHDAELAVHAWSFRSENTFLPLELRRGTAGAAYGDAAGEYAAFRMLGVDGVFTDHPDMAVAALADPALL